MSTYTEAKHVRGGDVANSGRYSHKTTQPAEFSLASAEPSEDLASNGLEMDDGANGKLADEFASTGVAGSLRAYEGNIQISTQSWPTKIRVVIATDLPAIQGVSTDLPEWPASIHEPELSVGDNNGEVELHATIGDKTKTFYCDGLGQVSTSGHDERNSWEALESDTISWEDLNKAQLWASEVTERIHADAERLKTAVLNDKETGASLLSRATGKATMPATEGNAPANGTRRIDKIFSAYDGFDHDDPETSVAGVLADLRHWAKINNVDLGTALESSEGYFADEDDTGV